MKNMELLLMSTFGKTIRYKVLEMESQHDENEEKA